MPSGYDKSGPANNANSDGEVAFTATFIPTFSTGRLVVCGTAGCKAPGIASVRIEYKSHQPPPGTDWVLAGLESGSGSGRVAMGPSVAALVLVPGVAYDFRVVIQGPNTETTEDDHYFTITVLELDPT